MSVIKTSGMCEKLIEARKLIDKEIGRIEEEYKGKFTELSRQFRVAHQSSEFREISDKRNRLYEEMQKKKQEAAQKIRGTKEHQDLTAFCTKNGKFTDNGRKK